MNVVRAAHAVLLASSTACVVACAGGPAPRPTSRVAPRPMTCELVGIEVIDEPAQAHTDRDASVLMLRYRPLRAGSEGDPFSLRVVIQRAREEELRAELRQHSVVVCEPAPTGEDESESPPP